MRQQAIATAAAQQQRLPGIGGQVMRGLGAALQVDQRGDGLAVTAATGQQAHRGRIHPPVAAKHQQRVDTATGKGGQQGVTRLELQATDLHLVALQGTYPALLADHHRHRLVNHLDLGHGLLLGLDQRAPRVAMQLGIGFDFLDHGALQGGRVGQDVLELALLAAQCGQFLFDLDGFQAGQLAQPDLEDVFGLAVAQAKALDQRRLGLVAGADDADHLVDVEQHQLPALEHMDAVEHLVEPETRAPLHRLQAEGDPLAEHLAQALLRRSAVSAHHGQVDGGRALQAGVGQQRGDQLLLGHGAALGLEDQAHRGVLARFIAHRIQHRQQRGLELHLVCAQGLLAGLDLGVAELLDLFQHLLRAGAWRQFGHHQLPLAAGHVLDLPASAHLEAAAACGIGGADVLGAADDLAAAGVVGAGQQCGQAVVGQGVVLDQRNGRRGHLAQVVRGHLGGQAHGDATGPIQQHKGQPCGQLARLLGGAVVVGDKVDRAFVHLVQQQPGDGGQAGLGVAHRRRAVTVSRAKIALAVHQRVALGKVLRHAHHGVVGGLVTVGVIAAQHIAHHPRTLDGLRATGRGEGQAHALHGVEDAPLHRFLAVTHIGQRPALDHAECVLQVGPFGVVRQAHRIGARGFRDREQVGHGAGTWGSVASGGAAGVKGGRQRPGCAGRVLAPASTSR